MVDDTQSSKVFVEFFRRMNEKTQGRGLFLEEFYITMALIGWTVNNKVVCFLEFILSPLLLSYFDNVYNT